MSWWLRYREWLHTRWPAGRVEKLPVVGEDGETHVSGLRIVGDLCGVPLLKFASETGARAVRAMLREPGFAPAQGKDPDRFDLAIIGGGVSGVSAAMEAVRCGLRYVLFESSEPFSTVVNFPRGKPIFTYPTDMTPAGGIQYPERANVKEPLLDELRRQLEESGIEVLSGKVEKVERRRGEFLVHRCSEPGPPVRALRVIVAIGRSGSFRKLGVPGEDLDKVTNRLHDPRDFQGKDVLVVGGGDSALETAAGLACCGARVTLSYRGREFSRPKPENIERVRALEADPETVVCVESPSSERVGSAADSRMRGEALPGSLRVAFGSEVEGIDPEAVRLRFSGEREAQRLPNDAVFVMTGREPPLDFLRRSGLHIRGDRTRWWWLSLILVLALFIFIYHWKGNAPVIPVRKWFAANQWFPFNLPEWLAGFGGAWTDPAHFLGALREAALGKPDFYYALAYCLLVIIFGIRRMQRRRTPYVAAQTLTLTAIQVIPLFLLPYLLLPWMGNNGWFDAGPGQWMADLLFPADAGGERAYWHSFGLILAWPLFVYNVFTGEPLWGWLAISFLQTFVLIPWMVMRWGKGAYCGWICSCGALAETLGDTHRHKMPHGPLPNRLNMIGQVFLGLALLLLVFRLSSWIPGLGFLEGPYYWILSNIPIFNYQYFVDLLWAGILGFGLYFHFSGRVWCRFACPLAALMHIYARFGKFRIFADKSKCISCNVCTTVCHQGIDVMNFANKGQPMEDPQCVRCSACVEQCPTGVLSFGRLDAEGRMVKDRLAASPVQMREGRGKAG